MRKVENTTAYDLDSDTNGVEERTSEGQVTADRKKKEDGGPQLDSTEAIVSSSPNARNHPSIKE